MAVDPGHLRLGVGDEIFVPDDQNRGLIEMRLPHFDIFPEGSPTIPFLHVAGLVRLDTSVDRAGIPDRVDQTMGGEEMADEYWTAVEIGTLVSEGPGLGLPVTRFEQGENLAVPESS